MWCDNCCLLFPLRSGAIAWAFFIFIYSIIGGVLLFLYGQFWFFTDSQWDIYAAICFLVVLTALVQILALSNRSFVWTRVCKFLWPGMILISAVRDVVIAIELKNGESNIDWECANGGQLWPPAQDPLNPTTKLLPSEFCNAGFSTFYTAWIAGILIDIAFQLYMMFLNWRFVTRFEHYNDMKPFGEGFYS